MTTGDHPADAPLDGPGHTDGHEDLLDALVRTSFLVMGALTRIAADHDLSLTQLRVLGILRDRRPRMAELADHLGLDKSTMSGLISRAERRGLLERRKSPDDARATDVVMTPAGHELAERINAEIRRALTPTTERLDATDARTVADLLDRMLAP